MTGRGRGRVVPGATCACAEEVWQSAGGRGSRHGPGAAPSPLATLALEIEKTIINYLFSFPATYNIRVFG